MNQGFKLEKIGEIRSYLSDETSQNELMIKKHKKVFRVLNYIDHLLIAILTINGCVSISAFDSIVGVPIGIASSTIGLKICVITAGIRKYIVKQSRQIVLINYVLKEFYDMKEEIKNSNKN